MMRVVRAFFGALALTLRGQSPTPSHYAPLENWIDGASRRLAEVIARSDALGIDAGGRAAIALKLDGRETSLDQTLRMLRHSLVNEYPRLMRLDDAFSMMVVQSINMNDQYRVSQFAASELIQAPELRRSLAALDAHLQRLPTIEPPSPDS